MMRRSERVRSWLGFLPEAGWDGIFAIVALLLISRIFNPILPQLLTNDYIIYWMLYVLFGVLMIYRFGIAWIGWVLHSASLLVFVLVATLCSTLWSLEPWLSFRTAMALIGNTLIGIFIGFRFVTTTMMSVLLCFFIVLMAVNLVVVVAFPGYGVEEFNRGYLSVAWKGALANKNQLGMMAALSLALFATGTLTRRIPPLAGVPLCVAAIVLLVMAQAATSQIAACVGAGLLATFLLAERLRFPSLLVVIILILLGALAIPFVGGQVDLLTGMVARDATLTTRTMIWRDALQVIADSPLIGHGYRSVWGLGDENWFPHLEMVRLAGHAHNGYLQLATDLGIPVGVIACLYLLQTTYAGLQLHMWRRGSFALFALIFFPICLVINMAETWLFWPDNFMWVVFVAVGISTTRLLSAVQPHRSRGLGNEDRRAATAPARSPVG